MLLRLYHGTTAANAAEILKDGLRSGSGLTPDLAIAREYAEAASDVSVAREGEEGIVVLAVTVAEENLRYDGKAMAEPVGHALLPGAVLDQRSARALARASRENPGWCQGGRVEVPAREWRISMEAVGSVEVGERVDARSIEVHERMTYAERRKQVEAEAAKPCLVIHKSAERRRPAQR